MTNQEALRNIKYLGRMFHDAVYLHGHTIRCETELMDGLVAYQMLNLKGEWDYIDESFDIVMRIIYKEVKARVGVHK